MMLTGLVALVLGQVTRALDILLAIGAGTGLVLILRWYWWRVNAWSEIAAMIAPFIAYGFVKWYTDILFPESLFVIVGFTTLVWVAVTFLTKPTDERTLTSFYRKVHPGGTLWNHIAAKVPDVKGDSGFALLFADWFAGVVLVYSVLFGTGKLILGETGVAALLFLVGILAGTFIYRNLSRHGWEKVGA